VYARGVFCEMRVVCCRTKVSPLTRSLLWSRYTIFGCGSLVAVYLYFGLAGHFLKMWASWLFDFYNPLFTYTTYIISSYCCGTLGPTWGSIVKEDITILFREKKLKFFTAVVFKTFKKFGEILPRWMLGTSSQSTHTLLPMLMLIKPKTMSHTDDV
jgi:hypothetical protein